MKEVNGVYEIPEMKLLLADDRSGSLKKSEMILAAAEEAGDDLLEGHIARGLRIPTKPSESEVKAHELTHVPARSWCRWAPGSGVHPGPREA